MIRTIVLDFGKVVGFFDHDIAIRKLLPYTKLDGAEIRQRIYTSDLEDSYERGAISSSEFAAEALRLGEFDCSADMLLSCFADVFTRNPIICNLVPKLAKRYRLILASNTNEAHYLKFREQFADTLKYFAFLGVSHEAKARKPEDPFYAYCHQYSEAERHECVFVDDILSNIEGARKFGWHAVQYHDGEEFFVELQEAGVSWSDD